MSQALVKAEQSPAVQVPAGPTECQRGCPVSLSTAQLWLFLLWCALKGMNHYEQWVPPCPSTCDLDPFASYIVAVDETTLDAVTRQYVLTLLRYCQDAIIVKDTRSV